MSQPPTPTPDDAPLADRAQALVRERIGSLGFAAGLLGTAVLAMRWVIRPATKSPVPESISPWFFATRAFQSSRGQMIYHESGTGPGPTLVFIHDLGVGASSYEWSKVYTAFVDAHRVLALDLIGFGESDRPKHRLTAEDYAASVAEFIEAVAGGGNEPGLRPVVVIASGMGAGFATVAAARRPDLISRLLLWMPAGAAGASRRLNLASRFPTLNRFVYRNLLARRGAIRHRLAALSQKGADAATIHAESVEVAALCAQQYQAEFAIYHWLQGRLDLDLCAAMRDVKVPVTLLWPEGGASAKSEQLAQQLLACQRLCSLRRLSGAGPLAWLEVPGEVASLLKDELRSDLRLLKAS